MRGAAWWLLTAMMAGCAGAPHVRHALPDTSFLGEAAFQTAQERLLVLAPEGLISLKLDGGGRRLLIDAPDCAYRGADSTRTLLGCGARLYALDADKLVELRGAPAGPPAAGGRVSGCTSGARHCVCEEGWHPEVARGRLLWAHENGDWRTLARVSGRRPDGRTPQIEDPFVTGDCQVVGFHYDGAVYLLHLRSGRIGRLARGSTVRWPGR